MKKEHLLNNSHFLPFGMLMPNRRQNSAEYRFGFQGQEKDDETKGQGNSINFKFRMYDPRIGRFFARDPLASKYPYYTPYSFSGNRVIDAYEFEGLEPIIGDKNYGENIFFGWEEHFNNVHPKKRNLSNKNWISSVPRSLTDVSEFILNTKLKLKNFNDTKLTVKTIVIVTHGVSYPDGTSGLILSKGEDESFARSTTGIDVDARHIDFFIELQGKGLLEDPSSKDFMNEVGTYIQQLQNVMNEVGDDGDLIFMGCDIGKDNSLMESLYKLSGNRLNIYANSEISQISGNTNSLEVLNTTFGRGNGIGWLVIGPINGGSVTPVNEGDNQIILSEDEKPLQNE